jgi:hypothetical protein
MAGIEEYRERATLNKKRGEHIYLRSPRFFHIRLSAISDSNEILLHRWEMLRQGAFGFADPVYPPAQVLVNLKAV